MRIEHTMNVRVPTFLIVLSYVFTSAMPSQPYGRGAHSCIVGSPRENPKDLRDYSIETCAILVQFTDNLADTNNHTPARYDSMFYSTDCYYGQYRAGSLNDFFIENSYGTTAVVGGIAGNQWYTSLYTYSHYDDNYYMLTNGYELARDAVALVDATIDFQQYDSDSNGHIDGVFVIHAGPGAEDTGNPHQCWSHAIPSFNYVTDDGIIIDGATNVPEINLVTPDLDTTLCCIAVMCHELGHVVGLPDLYDGSRDTWGVGYWSLMGYGAWGAGGNTPWSPSHVDAWCKMQVNWLEPISILSNTYSLKILDSETHPIAYRVWRNGAINDTFFILENRQKKGFDTPLPGLGLLIWHIDPRYDDYHNFVDLEEADGRDDLDNGWGYRPDPHYYHPELGDAGDPFPGDSGTILFDSLSYPSSDDNWGNPTHITVQNITLVGDTIVCDILITPDAVSEYQNYEPNLVITVSPNPFKDLTIISLSGECSGNKINLQIYDITGTLVKSFNPKGLRTEGQFDHTTMRLSDHIIWDGRNDQNEIEPVGIYWCVFTDNTQKFTEKIIFLH
jgi:M6 family metalloprotease-like protein